MFSAACEGDLTLVEYHVKSGADPNYVHPEILGTVLVASILAKQEPVAMLLLENGADPHLLSEFEGLTPFQAARQSGMTSVEARLLELGARAPTGSAQPASAEAVPRSWVARLWSLWN